MALVANEGNGRRGEARMHRRTLSSHRSRGARASVLFLRQLPVGRHWRSLPALRARTHTHIHTHTHEIVFLLLLLFEKITLVTFRVVNDRSKVTSHMKLERTCPLREEDHPRNQLSNDGQAPACFGVVLLAQDRPPNNRFSDARAVASYPSIVWTQGPAVRRIGIPWKKNLFKQVNSADYMRSSSLTTRPWNRCSWRRDWGEKSFGRSGSNAVVASRPPKCPIPRRNWRPFGFLLRVRPHPVLIRDPLRFSCRFFMVVFSPHSEARLSLLGFFHHHTFDLVIVWCGATRWDRHCLCIERMYLFVQWRQVADITRTWTTRPKFLQIPFGVGCRLVHLHVSLG